MVANLEPEKIDVVGVGVTASTFAGAVAQVDRWIAQDARQYVCIADVHAVIQCRAHDDLQALYRTAGMVTTDGMPLVWMCRQLGETSAERVYGPDLMTALTAKSPEHGYRHYYYGGADGVADDLKQKLESSYPGLQVVGTKCPPFRDLSPAEEDAVVAEINAAKPDILWVGLGAPKQERWMAKFRARLDVPVIIGVGAAFDFLSGRKPQAPTWMQRNGLEWLFRLSTEPRRLGKRYLWVVPTFAVLAAGQLMSQRTVVRGTEVAPQQR